MEGVVTSARGPIRVPAILMLGKQRNFKSRQKFVKTILRVVKNKELGWDPIFAKPKISRCMRLLTFFPQKRVVAGAASHRLYSLVLTLFIFFPIAIAVDLDLEPTPTLGVPPCSAAHEVDAPACLALSRRDLKLCLDPLPLPALLLAPAASGHRFGGGARGSLLFFLHTHFPIQVRVLI